MHGRFGGKNSEKNKVFECSVQQWIITSGGSLTDLLINGRNLARGQWIISFRPCTKTESTSIITWLLCKLGMWYFLLLLGASPCQGLQFLLGAGMATGNSKLRVLCISSKNISKWSHSGDSGIPVSSSVLVVWFRLLSIYFSQYVRAIPFTFAGTVGTSQTWRAVVFRKSWGHTFRLKMHFGSFCMSKDGLCIIFRTVMIQLAARYL